MDAGHWPNAVADPVNVLEVSRFAHQIILKAEVVAEDDVAAVFSATLGQGLAQSSRTSTWEIL